MKGKGERIRELVDDEQSIGRLRVDRGELGAMVIIDATARFLPDVLGNNVSWGRPYHNLLEFPHIRDRWFYRKVPEVFDEWEPC